MRKRGQGSISKRNDGRWEINLRFQGTRYRLYAKTKAEAEAKLRQLRNQVFAFRVRDIGFMLRPRLRLRLS